MNHRRFLRALLALSMLLAAMSSRAGTIAGRILDANGKPLAGSRITWVAYRADDELLLQETDGTTPAVLGEVKSDESGRFQAALEKPGLLLSVRVITPGFPEARLAGPYDSGDATDLTEIRLPNPAKLSGRVVDDAGKPVAGARVTIAAGGGGAMGDGEAVYLSEAKAGADGSFALANVPEGPRAVSARARGFLPMVRFALEGRSEERIVLRRGGVIKGILTDSAGKPVEGAIVTCEDAAARTDASGAYRLSGVPFGSQAVETVYKEDFAARKEGVRVPREGEADAPLKLSRAAALTGSVIEESSRKPIAGVRLSVLNPGLRLGRRRAERVVRTDAKGRFRAGGLGARRYTVEAVREGYLPSTIPNVTAALASPGTVAIALARAATVAGVVKDEKGLGVAGARVRLQRDPNLRALMRGTANLGALMGQSALTSPEGTFVLRGLTAQKGVTLEATKEGFAAGRLVGVSWKTGEQVKNLSVLLKKGLSARGKVVDAQSLPIAGAQVNASRRDLAGGRAGGAMIRMNNLAQAGARPDAVSGPDGTFTVTGLDEGEYSLAVKRDGYAHKTVSSLQVKSSEENVWPPVVLAGGVAVSGSIRDTAGQPVIGAQIMAIDPNAGRPQDASTDGNGGFRIGGLSADRPILLNINADGYAMVQRNVTPPAENLAIVLKTTGTVRGRVEDAGTKNPVTDFSIGRTAGGGFGGGIQIQIRNGQFSTGDRAFQSADGSFELTDVPAGKWTIRGSASGYRSADVSGIEVGEGETKEGVVLSLKKGGTLSGRVLDPNKGTGVPNASVSWRAQGGGGMGGFGGAMVFFGGGSSLTATDADGKFSFDGLPEGKVTVTATHPDYLDAARDVSPDDQSSVDITLAIGGSISGTVFSAGGRMPIPGAQVSLDEEGDASNFAGNRTRTDANGGFVFDHLAAARYKLTAQSTTGNSQPREVILAENQSQGGVLLEMIVGVRLHGAVTGLPAGRLGGVRVTANAPNYSDATTTDDNGQYALKDVPPGVIRLNASTSFMQGRSTTQTVNIDGSAPDVQQDIVFEGVSSLAGRVTRGGKPLAGLFVIALPDSGGQGQRFTSQTDENGAYELDGMTDGAYQVTVNGQGVSYRRAFAVSGATSGDIVLPGVIVSGTIVDAATSQPIEGATIQAQTGSETQTPAIKRGVTDSNGRYELDDLDSGNYQVSARKTGYMLKTQSVTVASDPAQLDFSLQPGTGLQIRVLDGQTGTPLHAVSTLAFGASGSVPSPANVSLDATGSGEIPSLPAGRYSIYIFSDGYAPRVFPAVDVPAPLLTVTMTPGGRVDVTTSVAATGRIVDGQGAIYLLGPFNLTGRINVSPPITSWLHLAPGSYNYYVQTPSGEKAYPFTAQEGRLTPLPLN